MDTVARWVCELIGFSGCNMLSPADVALFAWATAMVGLIVALLLVGFVLGRDVGATSYRTVPDPLEGPTGEPSHGNDATGEGWKE
jgi:hypothetical protein